MCNVYFRFPVNVKDNIRKKWDNFLIENFLNPKNVTKSSLICSSHFEESKVGNYYKSMSFRQLLLVE